MNITALSGFLSGWTGIALLSLVLMGLANFCNKIATHHGLSAFGVIGIIFIVNTLMALVLFLTKKPDLFSHPSAIIWAVCGGLFSGTALLLLVTAFSKPGSQAGVATAIMNANFALVALLGLIFLRETLTLKQLLGLLAMTAGLFLLI